jgi:hypothetical protein
MSASAVEMGFLHDFLVPKDLVFVNGFWASRSLCALKIWASAAELGSHDDFWVGPDTFFVNGFSVSSSLCALKMSASGVELGFLDDFFVQGSSFHQRFLSRQYSMCPEDFSVSRRTRFRGWFLHPRELVFVNCFWAHRSLCALKMSASAVEVGFLDDFWVLGT